MPIPVLCPECGAKIIAPDSELGRRMKCPTCGDQITVVSVNDVERDVASADASPLDPGWEKVAVGYRMLGLAALFLLVGVFCTVAVAVIAWAAFEQKQEISNDTPRKLIGSGVGIGFGLLVMVFTSLGHANFLAVPTDAGGGMTKGLAVSMLALGVIPGLNGLALLLLPVFSARVGTALNNPRLTSLGWYLYAWFGAVFGVHWLTAICFAGGNDLGIPVVGFIAGATVEVGGWVLVFLGVWWTLAAFRRGIEDAVRERGTRG